MSLAERFQNWLPIIGASVSMFILSITIVSLVLTAAQAVGLTSQETASWIIALFGIPQALGVILSIVYRQPLILTGNVFLIIFVASVGDEIPYPEIIGACMVAGLSIFVVSLLGLTKRLAAWIPAPIVMGIVAGAVIPFVSDIFALLSEDPIMIGGIVLAYLLSRRLLGSRLPAVLPALAVGLVIAALTGQFGSASAMTLPAPLLTTPVFSLRAIATLTPVLLVLLTVQSTVPSIVFLQSQGYKPPDRVIYTVGGIGTIPAALFGPTGMSLSLPATSLVAGPPAGKISTRYWAAVLASGGAVLIALLAGIAAELPMIIPLGLLLTLAGLALVDALAGSLQRITKGPLIWGPLFAFVITLSEISLFGFGPFFWALVLGMAISLLLESDKMGQSPVPESE